MAILCIYETDPTGGWCGFPAEIPGLPPANSIRQELIRRNKIIKRLEFELKIEVKRVFLRTPGSPVDNPHVKTFLQEKGSKSFPIFLYGDEIIHSGTFPDLDTLSQKIMEKNEK
ncbi:MAG: arsenic metallochaperone ArsD family protein [Promethearchaeota archaeon]